MKCSIRRNHRFWLALVPLIHFTVQRVITIGHGLHEIVYSLR